MKFRFEGTPDELFVLVDRMLDSMGPLTPAAKITPMVTVKPTVPAPVVAAPLPPPVVDPVPAVDPSPEVEPDLAPRKPRGRPKKVAAAPEEVASPAVDDTPAEVEEEEPVAGDVPQVETEVVVSDKPSRDDVIGAMESLIRNKGIVAAKGVLGSFGVSKLPDVPETMWLAFIQKAVAAGA